MFIDIAKIKIRAGDGGNGAVSFQREKYVAAGGPTEGTAERAETSFLSPTTTFRPLRIFAIKGNTPPKTASPEAENDVSAKTVPIL